MTTNLDEALEPGETVVYRTRGRSYASSTIYFCFLGTLAMCIPFYTALSHPVTVTWTPYFVIAGVYAAGGLFALSALRAGQRQYPDDLAITGRRILFANSDRPDKLESLALDRIERISWFTEAGIRRLKVEGGDTEVKLPRLREGAAADRIADAAGIAPPPALGHISAIDPVAFAFGPAFVVALLAYFAFNVTLETIGPFAPDGLSGIDDPLLNYGVLLPIGVAVMLAGWVIGAFATLILMRACMTFERMRVLLCAGKPENWLLRLALRWAGLLYGRPMPYLAC